MRCRGKPRQMRNFLVETAGFEPATPCVQIWHTVSRPGECGDEADGCEKVLEIANGPPNTDRNDNLKVPTSPAIFRAEIGLFRG